jgi:S1-C subfamily serine protease
LGLLAAILGGFLLLFLLLFIATISYPTWYQNLPFRESLPDFLKPASYTERILNEGGTTIRTVEESAVIEVVDKTSPAVVSIVAKTVSFDPDRGAVTDQQGIGTGFIIESDGLIVTNNHVVCTEGVDYAVVTKDNKTFDVKKIDLDPANDIALIRIDTKGLPFLELGDSNIEVLKAGQKVIAIGNALGQFQNSVTVGVLSGLGRGITAGSTGCANQQGRETIQNVMQTDAALNPGNSGGPLLDLSGKVIGVNFAVSGGGENLGFVIPINRVKDVIAQYKKDGRIIKPYLGVVYQTIDQDIASVQKVPQGAFVRRVVSGSPAAKANIQAGDIITEIDGQKLGESNDLVSVLNTLKAGQKVDIKVYRDNKTVQLSATLAEAPSD